MQRFLSGPGDAGPFVLCLAGSAFDTECEFIFFAGLSYTRFVICFAEIEKCAGSKSPVLPVHTNARSICRESYEIHLTRRIAPPIRGEIP
jgi:hypothetical protein